MMCRFLDGDLHDLAPVERHRHPARKIALPEKFVINLNHVVSIGSASPQPAPRKFSGEYQQKTIVYILSASALYDIHALADTPPGAV